eukprot:jgi/Chrzof1/8718/Cz03g21230.t1
MSFQVDITSTEAWKAEVVGTPGVLQVVEVYQGWCGPCKAIASTFKRLYFEMSDRPLKFYTVNADKVQGLEKYRGCCQPQFLFYKDGKVLDSVVGVQAPPLTKLITSLSEVKAV